jgi:hypothetical protein
MKAVKTNKFKESSAYLEPLKVGSALRSEILKFEYRQKNKPTEINILDYTVMAALEKQMPVKVKPNKRIPGICKCPICKTELCEDEDLNYCPTCGQRLKS